MIEYSQMIYINLPTWLANLAWLLTFVVFFGCVKEYSASGALRAADTEPMDEPDNNHEPNTREEI